VYTLPASSLRQVTDGSTADPKIAGHSKENDVETMQKLPSGKLT
jgi:hypothetical protein